MRGFDGVRGQRQLRWLQEESRRISWAVDDHCRRARGFSHQWQEEEMLRRTVLAGSLLAGAALFSVAASAEELKNQIASEVKTGTTRPDGRRRSKDSDWTVWKVPESYVINKDKTTVQVVSAYGSEHSYQIEYGDDVEIIPDTGIKQPTTIRVKTHARSAKGPYGGAGSMKILVDVYYVKYK
ncbi:hypothetical protein [Pseudorhodoferax sp.]|uniref:hypothetical protein n=1 Tax=Pseudorhodoferax sp. TaxID=1993553 RepID=UPI0039E483DC